MSWYASNGLLRAIVISCGRRVTNRVLGPPPAIRRGRLQASSLARATDPTPDQRYSGVLEGLRFAGEISACAHVHVAKERQRQPAYCIAAVLRDARHSLLPSVAAKSASPTRGSARARHEHPIIEVSVADPWE